MVVGEEAGIVEALAREWGTYLSRMMATKDVVEATASQRRLSPCWWWWVG
jgi:hypothetical protein